MSRLIGQYINLLRFSNVAVSANVAAGEASTVPTVVITIKTIKILNEFFLASLTSPFFADSMLSENKIQKIY